MEKTTEKKASIVKPVTKTTIKQPSFNPVDIVNRIRTGGKISKEEYDKEANGSYFLIKFKCNKHGIQSKQLKNFKNSSGCNKCSKENSTSIKKEKYNHLEMAILSVFD